MKRNNASRCILVHVILAILLMTAGCKESGNEDAEVSESQSVSYDYDEAATKLITYSGVRSFVCWHF